jgi:hypothetical protein
MKVCPILRVSSTIAIGIWSATTLLQADTLTLRTGETIRGTYLGGTARQVRMDLNGDIRTYDVGQVQSISFTDGDYQPPRASNQSRPSYDPPVSSSTSSPPRLRRAPDSDSVAHNPPPPPPAPSNAGVTIPVDTTVTIRMIDAVNSETARLGQTFRANLDEPIVVDGREVVPRGADVLTKLVADQQSGKIEGRTVLTLALSTITVNGRPVDVTSTDVETSSGSRGGRSAKVIGGTAALGAVIGAIAGGGKGAAIGAGSGAAVGTGAEVLTAGQKVKIPSETRLVFRLQNPVQI